MADQSKLTAATLPATHVSSLKRIESGYWWYVGRVQWAARFIKKWALAQTCPIKYADLGCGTGGFASALHAQFGFSRVALVDGDRSMLREAPSGGVFEQHHCNLQEELSLPFVPDLISCMDVIEHLKNDQLFLQSAARCLRPGGKLVLSVPAHQWLYSGWDKVLGHYRRYNKRDLVGLLRQSGLHIDSASYMWAAFAPLGFYRKFHFQEGTDAEFPPVSDLLNHCLKTYSDTEWVLSRLMPLPFGTSLILSATKP